jgi:hypothetical protein
MKDDAMIKMDGNVRFKDEIELEDDDIFDKIKVDRKSH